MNLLHELTFYTTPRVTSKMLHDFVIRIVPGWIIHVQHAAADIHEAIVIEHIRRIWHNRIRTHERTDVAVIVAAIVILCRFATTA